MRDKRADGFTIEKLACDCLDVRFLRRKGFAVTGEKLGHHRRRA